MTATPTLSLRDRTHLVICLQMANPPRDDLACACDDALCDEIGGAVNRLPEMTLPERIQHAFEAQRLEIDLPLAAEIGQVLFFDGVPPTWNARIAA